MTPGVWPAGGGEMARRIREHDWAATPLGPVGGWPAALRVALAGVLADPRPSALLWGPELTALHNDAYRPLLGGKPDALGRPFLAVWAEARDVIAPLIDRALAGEATSFADARFTVERGAGPEDARFDYAFVPVRDEAGRVAGVLNNAVEVTARKRAEEALRAEEGRQAFLLKLSDALRAEPDPDAVGKLAVGLFAEEVDVDRCYTNASLPAEGAWAVPQQFHREHLPPLPATIPAEDHPRSIELVADQNLVYEDTAEDPRLSETDRASLRTLGFGAMLVSALRQGEGNAIWAFVAVSSRPRRWTSAEISLIGEVAERTWAAIERARAEAALRESEASLRESEARLRQALDTADLGTWAWDLATGRGALDARGAEIVGLGGAVAPGEPFDVAEAQRASIHPDDLAAVERATAAGVEAGGAFVLRYRAAGPDGRPRHVVSNVRVEADGAGRPVRLSGTNRDATAEREAEAALRRSEERQAFLLRLGDAMRAQSSASGKIEVAARHLGERLNASRVLFAEFDEARGVADVFNGWFADGAQPFPTIMRLENYEGPVLDELRAGRTVRIDNAGPLVEDPAFAAIAEVGVRALLSVPLRVGGRLVVNLSVHQHEARRWTDDEAALVREVAERLWAEVVRARAEAALAASEEKYRTLFDSIDEGLAIVEMIYDDRGEIVEMIFRQVNAAYERHGGIYNVVGRSVSEMLPGVEDVWLDRYERVARTGRPIRVEDYQQDVGRWFDVYFSRVDNDGRFVAIVFNDITERKRAEAELREKEERQAFLLELTDILQRLTAPDDIKTAAMRALGAHLGVGRAQYHEVDGSGEHYSADGIGYADGLPLLDLSYRIDQFGGFVAEDFEAGRPFRSDDLLADPRPTAEEREAYGSYQIRAGAGIPLLRGGRLVAILAVHDTRPHPWTDLEMELIRETAERVWVAVEKARAEVAVRGSEERQAFLLKLSDALRAEGDPDAVGRVAVGMLARHMGVDRCYVARTSPEGLGWVGPEHHAPELAPMAGEYRVHADFPEAMRRLETEPLIIRDLWNDPALSELDRSSIAAIGIEALLVGALRRGEEFFWGLAVGDRSPRAWTDADRLLVEEAAERTWAAVERARAEEALRESEERNRLIVEGARDYAIITTDPEGRIASWSAGAEAVLGWTAEEALGRPAAITFVPEDREAGVPEEELATARRHGVAPDVRWHLRKDGSRVFIEGTARALGAGDGGGPRGFLKVGQDVTERRRAEEALRESEEKYRTLVENVGGHAVFMLDSGGLVAEWTESARRVKGYAAEEAVGRHFSMFYPPEEAGEPERELAEAAREGRAEREGWRVRKGGERIWVNEIATAVRGAEGELVGFAKIARDLTERRELEQERERGRARARELTATAEAAERERISRELHDRVAHHMGVAHQSLELHAALREAAPGRAAERLDLARESTRAALDQTRALSAELKRLQEEELENGLGAALRALGALMPDGAALEVSVSGDDSAVPEPVAVQAYLAMREAVRNAIRHSGGSRVGITLDVSDGEVRGLVEDDGEGFDPEAVGKASPSWGVGLRSMRERAEMLGGALRVDSEPGAGTRVELEVPLDGRRP